MSKHKCQECSREFETKEALEMHNKSKHYEKVKKPVDKKKLRNFGIFIVIIAIVILGGYALTIKNNLPGKYDDFAKCITENGAKMYGAWWCSHCKEQKQSFGKSFQYINYIECSTPDGNSKLPVCENAGIEGYPTWELTNGTRIGGFIPLEDLSKYTNCSIS